MRNACVNFTTLNKEMTIGSTIFNNIKHYIRNNDIKSLISRLEIYKPTTQELRQQWIDEWYGMPNYIDKVGQFDTEEKNIIIREMYTNILRMLADGIDENTMLSYAMEQCYKFDMILIGG